MKPTIIAIVGPSGSGKTFASEFLKKEKAVPVLVSYTTRPMRDGEINGVEHHFVEESEMPEREQMLAYTRFGDYHYWANLNQIPENGGCIYVIDEKGLLELIEKHDDKYCVIPVLIKRNPLQLSKSISRERMERDYSRTHIEDNFYHQIIDNEGTIDEFKENLLFMIEKIKV